MSKCIILSLWAACFISLAAPSGLSQVERTAPPADRPSTGPQHASIPGEFSDARAVRDAVRHAVLPAGDGWRARNPGQLWSTHFDERGFTTRPDSGDWAWGLELLRYGFDGNERPVDDVPTSRAAGGRVTYARDEVLSEWYVNDARGLEHGYTLSRRPPADSEPPALRFALRVRGDCAFALSGDRRDVTFSRTDGTAVLTYSGLLAFDADGRDLPAHFARRGDELQIVVDETGARYPVTIDPLAQQAYFKASNSEADDAFARSVALSGDTLVVGADQEDSNATGVDGNQADNSSVNAGAVYVFVRTGTTWSQQAYLKASNPGVAERFGWAVAISGDTLVVGALGEDSNATGINGDQNDDSASSSGAAYVFVRSGTTWSQQAYIKASNTDDNDQFGGAVALSGDTLVVAAANEDSQATGIDGDESDNSAPLSGAVYVFVRSGTTWSQQAYIKASNAEAIDLFGETVAVSGDTLAVGAIVESSNATGINGDESDNSAAEAGAVYVFTRSGTTWSQQAYIKASNAEEGDHFGKSVALSGDSLVVGAEHEDGGSAGINGDETDNSAFLAGAAYVFVRSGTDWSQQAYLKPAIVDVTGLDSFGSVVAIDGDIVVVSSPFEDSTATGVNGDAGDNGLSNTGAAYAFVRDGTNWSQRAYLKPSANGFSDNFGRAATVSGTTAVIGTLNEDSNATGVGGDRFNDSSQGSGAAWAFDLEPGPWTDLGCATNGLFGAPVLTGTGDAVPGSSGELSLTNARMNTVTLFGVSFGEGAFPAFGGVVKPTLPLDAEFAFSTGAAGSVTMPWASFPALASGTVLVFQFFIADAAHPTGVVLSNGLKVTVP